MNPSVTAWSSEFTSISGREQTFKMEFLILQLLTAIVALVGLSRLPLTLLLYYRCPRDTHQKLLFHLHIHPALFHNCVRVCLHRGLSFLSAICMERCLSVLWPIWYRCCPRHRSAGMCALLWALSLLLNILEGNYCAFLVRNMHHVWCPVLNFITVAWLILLFVLLSGSSLALMTRLLCGSNQVQPTRLYVTVVLTVLVFLLCDLPLGIHWFLLPWLEIYLEAFLHLYKFVVPLSCVNSCANPIIYVFVGSFRQRWWKWRHTLRLILQKALQDTPVVDEPGESLPEETLAMSGSRLGP